MHPLVLALAHVLGRLQEGIVAQAFRGPIEIEIELQAPGQRLGAFGQLALEPGIFADAAFPGVERRFPGVVGGEEAGKVPGVGGFDFAAGRKLFDLWPWDEDRDIRYEVSLKINADGLVSVDSRLLGHVRWSQAT